MTTNSSAGSCSSVGFIFVDPAALGGWAAYLDRVELLVREMLRGGGVRLPARGASSCAAMLSRKTWTCPTMCCRNGTVWGLYDHEAS